MVEIIQKKKQEHMEIDTSIYRSNDNLNILHFKIYHIFKFTELRIKVNYYISLL